MDVVATGTQLPNSQTFFFFILSEKPEKPQCHFARQHCTCSSSAEVTQVQDPSFDGTFQTEDACTFSFHSLSLCGATFAAAIQW